MTHRVSVVVVIVLALLLASCGGSATDIVKGTSPAGSKMAETPTVVSGTSEATTPVSPEATSTRVAVATPTVAPSPTAKAEAIQVESFGFGQPEGDRSVGWAFTVINPNSTLAFEGSQFQIALMDEAGTVLETDSGYLSLLMPSERSAVAGSAYVPEGAVAASMTVSFKDGRSSSIETTAVFTSSKVTYFPSDYFSYVTGVISNPYKKDLSDLRMSAVAYDASGAIIGGGFTYLNLIPAEGKTGAAVSVTTAGEPASVELFAAISGLTLLDDSTAKQPEKPLVLHAQGFGQPADDRQVGWGFIVENPNTGQQVETSSYRITAYDVDGRVIGTDDGYMTLLAPGEKVGYGGDIYIPEGTTAASVDVQIMAGKPSDSEAGPMLSTANATYIADPYSSKVTGTVSNLSDTTLDTIRVSAIAYDAAGAIIGGGFTYVDFVPARGNAAAEIYVTVGGEPASVELHAALTSVSR